MRELTRSMIRFSWAMPLFGLRQMTRMVMPGDTERSTERATRAFDAVAASAEGHLEGPFRQAFEAGDRLQRQVLDTVFRAVDVGR